MDSGNWEVKTPVFQ